MGILPSKSDEQQYAEQQVWYFQSHGHQRGVIGQDADRAGERGQRARIAVEHTAWNAMQPLANRRQPYPQESRLHPGTQPLELAPKLRWLALLTLWHLAFHC
jgi:hypothetical protein